MKRRSFIQNSALAAPFLASGVPLIKPFRAPKLRLALIGSGWWGNNILREAIASDRVELVGICDVDERELQKTTDNINKQIGQKPKWYKDYRECLADSKPEIVIVATPDHWHALPTIAAIEMGAHVYVEKPISHTILEGQAMLAAARTNERVVQVGTHRRVSPHMEAGMDFLRSGKAGKITQVKCFVNRPGRAGSKTEDSKAPEGLDWDMWLGPAPKRNFNRRIHPKGFRGFLDYANGTIGDWGIHWFDQVLWWAEERYPTSVFSTGDRFVKQDTTDTPDTQLAIFKFEDFTCSWEHKLTAANANEPSGIGCYFYGTEGTVHLGWRDGWTFYPSKFDNRKNPLEKIHMDSNANAPDHQNIKELWSDFMKAIDQKSRPISDIEDGYLATNMSLLAMISLKVGRSVQWDGKSILNDPEASEHLQRPYRAPWIYPS